MEVLSFFEAVSLGIRCGMKFWVRGSGKFKIREVGNLQRWKFRVSGSNNLSCRILPFAFTFLCGCDCN